MSAARDEILRRVRGGLEDVPASERPEDVTVVRGYLEREPKAGLERFVERVADYGSAVRVVGIGGIVGALSAACRDFDVSSLVVPKDLPLEWTPSGVELIPDTGLDVRELDRIGAALTGCALGIAETGTIVLDGGVGQGRRALSLVPDVHLCVIDETQVVDGVPAAFRQLGDAARARRPLTFVSGPSATSDIELARVEGVHGPRRFGLVVVSH